MAKYRSRIDLREFFENLPKDSVKVKDYFFDNIGRVKSAQLGLNQRPVSLLDVLSYQDNPEWKDFDFFETYENSDAAKQNLKYSEDWTSKLNSFTDEESEFIDDLYESDINSVASMISDRVKQYVEEIQQANQERSKNNQEDNNESD